MYKFDIQRFLCILDTGFRIGLWVDFGSSMRLHVTQDRQELGCRSSICVCSPLIYLSSSISIFVPIVTRKFSITKHAGNTDIVFVCLGVCFHTCLQGRVGYCVCLCSLVNMTDSEDLARTAIASGVIQLVKSTYDHANAHKPLQLRGFVPETLAADATYVLSNLCNHEDLHAELLRADVPSALLLATKEPDEKLAFVSLLKLAFMLGGNDDKSNPHVLAAAACVPKICEALRKGGIVHYSDSGFKSKYRMVEILNPATRIVINDDNKQQMCDEGMMAALESVLEKHMPGVEGAEDGAAERIVSILLHLSFIPAGFNWLLERREAPDATLFTNLTALADAGSSAQLGKDAGSILFQISQSQSGSSAAPASPSVVRERHIMVSYCWGQKQQVMLFCKELRQLGFEVWRDEEGSKYVGPISGGKSRNFGDVMHAVNVCNTHTHTHTHTLHVRRHYLVDHLLDLDVFLDDTHTRTLTHTLTHTHTHTHTHTTRDRHAHSREDTKCSIADFWDLVCDIYQGTRWKRWQTPLIRRHRWSFLSAVLTRRVPTADWKQTMRTAVPKMA